MRALIATAAATLLACTDAAAPVAPPAPGPTLAANTDGPLAVESMIGLEPLVGAPNPTSIAYDISDVGQVVGSSSAPGNESHAVFWDPTTSVFPVDLGTLPGGTTSHARAINSIGTVIVGESETATLDRHAVRWVNVNGTWTIQDLGTLQGWTSGDAFDVADDGSIVGMWLPATGVNGFLWQNGVMTDLGQTGVARAFAVNNSRQVVGANSNDHAVLWTLAGGAMEIGTLGGHASVALDINAAGEIVGTALTTSNVLHAFLWTPRKGMVDLGTLGGATSEANGISPAAQVVGESVTETNERRAFLWAKGKMLNLGVLAGHTESVAQAINTGKQVVGWSQGPGSIRATLWTIK